MRTIELERTSRSDVRSVEPTSLRILRVTMEVSETSAPYNQLSRPLVQRQRISLCCYLPPSLQVAPEIRLFQGDGSLLGFIRALRRALRAEQYDVYHIHTPSLGLIFLLFGWRLAGRGVYTVHNSYQSYRLRNRLFLLPIFAAFRRVVLCSTAARMSLPWWLRWLGRGRITVVENGVDLDRIDGSSGTSARPPARDLFRVITVARLVPIKNLLALVDAFSKRNGPGDRLVIVGDGILKDEIADRAAGKGLRSRVELTGLLPRDEVYAHLRHSSVFVSMSHGEGLPVAVLEAMGCGCPVILSDIPPHRQIRGDADFIPLIAPHDTDGFSSEIQRFRQMTQGERASVGARCRSLVEERYSLAAMHSGYAEIYDELTRARFPVDAPQVGPAAAPYG